MLTYITQGELVPVIMLLLEIVGLLLVVLIDPYIKRSHRRIMLINIALIGSLLVQDLLNDYLSIFGDIPPLRTVVSIYGYAVRPVVLLLFCYFIGEERRTVFLWALTGINALIHLTALFSRVCFYISKSNHFYRGPLGYSSHVTSAMILLYLVWLSLKVETDRKGLQSIVPVFNGATIIVAVLLDSFIVHTQMGITFLSIAMVNSALFYYIWLHLQFVRDHENALMAEQRIRIMMSQIQPHFLYNTLSSIQALCLSDPEKAFDVTEKFGTYLRQNIDSLDQPQLIPFVKELEHTRVYSEIETIRFPSIRIEYDTPDTAFSIPALTVQPLVENAIRHGVRSVETGVVRVSSKLVGVYHEITISDNGKGFDAAASEASGGTHIGIRNVRERIEKMCSGTLTVESVIGSGTTVTIRISVAGDAKQMRS